MPPFIARLNIISECRASHLGLWSCPPFLFVIMGLVNVSGMLASWLFTNQFVAEPEIAALIVIAVSFLIFVIGVFIIHGFSRIAEANRMKSEFISIVSHQLRSPLSIFKWTLEIMARNSGSENAVGREIQILRDSAEKMIQLVNMLLEVSRIEAGRLILRRDPVNLEAVTAELIRSFKPYADAAKINLDYAPPSNLPAVAADREKLKMVIQNLMDNAIRYSPSGGRVTISVARLNHSFLEWKISDTGVGIPKSEQRFIFQKFFRASPAMRQQSQGSGLGLYIARSIIIALGGEIGFESDKGKGSTFWFRLPIYVEAK